MMVLRLFSYPNLIDNKYFFPIYKVFIFHKIISKNYSRVIFWEVLSFIYVHPSL